MTIAPKEKTVWLNQNRWGRKGSDNEWEVCSKHFSKAAAMKAAKKCQHESGIKHRVRLR